MCYQHILWYCRHMISKGNECSEKLTVTVWKHGREVITRLWIKKMNQTSKRNIILQILHEHKGRARLRAMETIHSLQKYEARVILRHQGTTRERNLFAWHVKCLFLVKGIETEIKHKWRPRQYIKADFLGLSFYQSPRTSRALRNDARVW